MNTYFYSLWFDSTENQTVADALSTRPPIGLFFLFCILVDRTIKEAVSLSLHPQPPYPACATGFGSNLAHEKYQENDYTQHAARTNCKLDAKILAGAEVHHC